MPQTPNLFDLPKNSDASIKANACVLPMPFDATTSYRGGTASGPGAIIEASQQVDLYDADFGSFENHKIDCLDISQNILERNQKVKKLINSLSPALSQRERELKAINSLTIKNNKTTFY